ncbi:MAG: hypothetical protein LRY71_18320 [Bacillaceae bacterium]|nr:hypothetical protein [Bacillaceae bacterium]
MLKELSSDIIPLLSDFDSFDIDRRVMEPPSVSSSSFASLSGTALFGKHAFAPTREVPSLFDLFGDSEEEYWEARRQRDEAKWFYEDMKYEKEKLKNVKEKMRMIRFFIDDEKKLLDGLNEKLKKISSELKIRVKQVHFLEGGG